MSALAFWKAVVADRSNFLERIVGLLDDNRIRYCVIGGVAVNAYAEPMVTQDLDIVVVADDVARARQLLEREFRVKEFEHSLTVYDPDSKLQVQIQLDDELVPMVARAARREVLDLSLPVAAPRDLIRAKIAAAIAPARRRSKRGKDLLDVARLLTAFPDLRDEVPADLMPLVEPFLDLDE